MPARVCSNTRVCTHYRDTGNGHRQVGGPARRLNLGTATQPTKAIHQQNKASDKPPCIVLYRRASRPCPVSMADPTAGGRPGQGAETGEHRAAPAWRPAAPGRSRTGQSRKRFVRWADQVDAWVGEKRRGIQQRSIDC